MMDSTITPRTTLDERELDALWTLAQACQSHDFIDLRLNWNGLRARSGAHVSDWLYYHNGELMGFLTADGLGEDEAEITGMVHPNARRHGVFRVLVAETGAEAQRRGTKRLVFYSDRRSESAHAFINKFDVVYSHAEHLMMLPDGRALPAPATELEVRRASVDDAPAISQIIATEWGDDSERRRQRVAQEIAKSAVRYYIAMLNGQPIATMNIQQINDQPYVYALVTHPEVRGRGYGRQFLVSVLADVAKEQPGPIFLEVDQTNSPAIGLYCSLGFDVMTTYDYWAVDVAKLLSSATEEPQGRAYA